MLSHTETHFIIFVIFCLCLAFFGYTARSQTWYIKTEQPIGSQCMVTTSLGIWSRVVTLSPSCGEGANFTVTQPTEISSTDFCYTCADAQELDQLQLIQQDPLPELLQCTPRKALCDSVNANGRCLSALAYCYRWVNAKGFSVSSITWCLLGVAAAAYGFFVHFTWDEDLRSSEENKRVQRTLDRVVYAQAACSLCGSVCALVVLIVLSNTNDLDFVFRRRWDSQGMCVTQIQRGLEVKNCDLTSKLHPLQLCGVVLLLLTTLFTHFRSIIARRLFTWAKDTLRAIPATCVGYLCSDQGLPTSKVSQNPKHLQSTGPEQQGLDVFIVEHNRRTLERLAESSDRQSWATLDRNASNTAFQEALREQNLQKLQIKASRQRFSTVSDMTTSAVQPEALVNRSPRGNKSTASTYTRVLSGATAHEIHTEFLDEELLLDMLKAYYRKYDPSKTEASIQGIVDWTGRKGMMALNALLYNKYGEDLLVFESKFTGTDPLLPTEQPMYKTSRAHLRRFLYVFYRKHAPEKLAKIGLAGLAQEAANGHMDMTNEALKKQYGESLDDLEPGMVYPKGRDRNMLLEHLLDYYEVHNPKQIASGLEPLVEWGLANGLAALDLKLQRKYNDSLLDSQRTSRPATVSPVLLPGKVPPTPEEEKLQSNVRKFLSFHDPELASEEVMRIISWVGDKTETSVNQLLKQRYGHDLSDETFLQVDERNWGFLDHLDEYPSWDDVSKLMFPNGDAEPQC